MLARLPDHPEKKIDALLPWNWRQPRGHAWRRVQALVPGEIWQRAVSAFLSLRLTRQNFDLCLGQRPANAPHLRLSQRCLCGFCGDAKEREPAGRLAITTRDVQRRARPREHL